MKFKEKLPKNYKGNVDCVSVSGVVFVFLLVAVLFLIVADSIIYEPIRAEAALKYCENKGYDSYLDYTCRPLDSNVYGVRYGNPEYFLNIETVGD